MKAKTLLNISLSIILFTISCNKEPDTQTQPIADKTVDLDLGESLRNFINLANNAKQGKILKSDSKVPIDEAIRYISNSLNYEFCFPNSYFTEIKSGTVNIELPIINMEDKVYFVDALEGYNNAIDLIKNKYTALNETHKKLITCKVEQLGISNDIATCQVTYFIGIGQLSSTNILYPYGIHDEYYYCDAPCGNCDDLSNIVPGDGASDILEFDIRQSSIPQLRPGYRVYYEVDPNSPITLNHSDYRNLNDPQQPDNILDYYIYYTTDQIAIVTESQKCLGLETRNGSQINEMNFYRNGTITAMTSKLTELAKDFINIDIVGESKFLPGYLFEYKHTVSIQFGIMHIEPINGYPHEIDL